MSLIEAINAEIEDRTVQANESGEADEYAEELKGLQELKRKVENQLPLTYSEYEWLSDISAALRESEVRDELE